MVKLSVLLLALSTVSLPQPDVGTIIRRSVDANARDWKAAPSYDYIQRDRDSDGTTKTHEELMILGSPYERLSKVNGKLLSPEQRAREERNMHAAIEDRQAESTEQRAQRIAQYEKERKRDQLMMEQLTTAFDFTLTGEQKLDGHDVYMLRATPRAGYQPPNMETEVLKGMQGSLWIDKETFQWVKVEAEVINPVAIEGFLAEVEPGTHFELEKMPVQDGIWLPKHFSMKSKAKVLFLFNRTSQENESYSGYHKATPLPRPPS